VIAVAVETSHQLAAIGVAKRNRHVLGGHVEDVDHVPTREVAGCEIEASIPASRNLDGLPVVGASARGPVLASDRCKAELAFDRQSHDRLSCRIGQRSLARQTVLRQRERARLGAELLHDQDARAIEIDIRASQRIQLAGTKARECGDLKPCGKRRARQLARTADQLPDLFLAWRLLVTTTRTLRDAEPRKRVVRTTRPAFAEAVSLNIARSAGTVPLCLPPASHSPTISSSTWSMRRAP